MPALVIFKTRDGLRMAVTRDAIAADLESTAGDGAEVVRVIDALIAQGDLPQVTELARCHFNVGPADAHGET
jgi:hypothetical protein